MPEPEAVPAPPAPVEPVAAATPAPAPAPIEPVVAAATPTAPAPVAPPAVEAVATTPQASTVMASAEADATPSISESKLGAGTKAAAIQAAEPRSTAPLRILVTRRTQRDRIIGVQNILSDMGYLEAAGFRRHARQGHGDRHQDLPDGNNGMPETGAFNDELVKKVYEVAGKGEPPVGHLFVRQEFGRVFDGPVTFKDPETPLGTHLFTALKFAPGDTKTRWMAISVQGDDRPPCSTASRFRRPASEDLRAA